MNQEGATPRRADLSTHPAAKLVELLSAHVGKLEAMEKKRFDGWPEEFRTTFSEDISALHEVDERMRFKLRMQPRLGNRAFKPVVEFQSGAVRRLNCSQYAPDALAGLLAIMRKRLTHFEAHIGQDLFPDAKRKTGSEDRRVRARHTRLGNTISLLAELEARLANWKELK